MGFGLSDPSYVAFRCPTCGRRLDEEPSGASCPSGHRFDRAREGYLNLLPAGRLKGRPAGDNADMVRARRAVFDAGHYRPVQQAVARAVSATGAVSVLDAGCGEGAYLAAIAAEHRVGIDVSKDAIRQAAKRHRDCRFAVASAYHLPFGDATLDAVVTVFAPRPFEEFARVLRPSGVVITASPGPDHFGGLTQLIYSEPEPHEQRPHTHDAVERVRFDLALGQPDLTNLLQMTPYWWKATAEQQGDLATRTQLTVTIDVVVTTSRVTR